MKTATILLVAVTVFTGLLQQSSAAPAESGWNSLGGFVKETIVDVGAKAGKALDDVKNTVDELVDGVVEDIGNLVEELVKLVKKDIKTSEANLASIVKAVKEALAKAAGDKKERITKVKDWLDDFKDLVATLHKELVDAVTVGTKEALQNILARLSDAIKDIEADSAKVIKNLEGDLKALFEEKLKFILNNAYAVQKAIKNTLSGKGVDASEINAGEKIEKIIEELVKLVKKDIKSSDANLASIVKAVKEALAKAAGDKKERITKVKDWLDDFKDLVATLHKELIDAVTVGTKEALQNILARLSDAIKDIEADLAKVIKNLEGDLKVLFEEKLKFILNNAYAVQRAIKNTLSGKGVNASAINAGENIEKIIEELVKLVKKDIKTSDANLASIVKAINEALAEAAGDKKERITKVKDWLDDFKDLVATLHEGLVDAVTVGTKEALQNILARLSDAIKDIEVDLAKVIKNLEGDLKVLFEEKLKFILNNAYAVQKAIKNTLSGKGVNASAINAGENIEKIIEELVKLVKKDIKTSDANLASIVKAINEALAEAAGDKKERITKVKDWLDDFKDLVATLHEGLVDAVTVGTKEALQNILARLSDAIKDIEVDLAKVIKNLEGDLKVLFEEKLKFILNNAYAVQKAIKNTLSGKGVNASAINAGENIEKIIEKLVKLVKKDIKTSDANLASIVKAINEALAEAASDKKERITKVKDWLDDFKDLVATLHEGLVDAVTVGTKEALQNILARLSDAIKDIEVDLAKVIKNLEGDLKVLFEEKLKFILNNAYAVQKAIKSALTAY